MTLDQICAMTLDQVCDGSGAGSGGGAFEVTLPNLPPGTTVWTVALNPTSGYTLSSVTALSLKKLPVGTSTWATLAGSGADYTFTTDNATYAKFVLTTPLVNGDMLKAECFGSFVGGSTRDKIYNIGCGITGGYLYPNLSIVNPGQAGTLKDLYAYQNANLSYSITINNVATGSPYSFSGGAKMAFYTNPSQVTPSFELSTVGGTLSIAGGVVTVSAGSTYTATPGVFLWDMWDTALNLVVGTGRLVIRQTPAP